MDAGPGGPQHLVVRVSMGVLLMVQVPPQMGADGEKGQIDEINGRVYVEEVVIMAEMLMKELVPS